MNPKYQQDGGQLCPETNPKRQDQSHQSHQFQDDGDDTRYGYDDLMAFLKDFGDQK